MIAKEQIKEKVYRLCGIENQQRTGINLVEDLGFESIQIVKLIVDIETKFDIVFDIFEIDIDDFVKLDYLIDKVCELVNE